MGKQKRMEKELKEGNAEMQRYNVWKRKKTEK